ncbi:MAG TPA: histone deacetylase [Solirubrobacterales bacterium]|nr:histone deacetylase [Solirubrobacterales bacterium]
MTLYLSHPSSYRHDTGPHPENATRLRAIEVAIEAGGGLGLERVDAPAASREELERVHSAAHVDAIEAFSAGGGGIIDVDTVASRGSYEAALHAAGAAAWAARELLAGSDRAAFCALRPPGHHADVERAMGFCLFNNAAVAAAAALADGAERVLILDWDVHHGNGTEAIFAADPRVLYVSIHQAPLYPGTGPAAYEGEAEGEGYTINLPVAAGAGREEFCGLVEHLVAPVAAAYEPGLVIVSAGYDAHREDPLASCMLEAGDYADMAARVCALGAPVVVCLEGGYSPAALAASVVATIHALADQVEPRPAGAGAAEPHLGRLRDRWRLG